jgi:hypothetical protein
MNALSRVNYDDEKKNPHEKICQKFEENVQRTSERGSKRQKPVDIDVKSNEENRFWRKLVLCLISNKS